MKKHRKIFLCCLMIIGLNSIQAQKLLMGVTGNIGLSKVTSDREISGDFKVSFALSGNLGMFMEKKISPKSSLGIEVLWVQIEGKETIDDMPIIIFNGLELVEVGKISEKLNFHTSYLAIPIYYRFQTGKLGIKGGFQWMMCLFSSLDYEIDGELNGEPYQPVVEYEEGDLDRIDLGLKGGIDYQLNDKFQLRADYYHGLSNILSDDDLMVRKNRQISLGISYFFGANKAKEQE